MCAPRIRQNCNYVASVMYSDWTKMIRPVTLFLFVLVGSGRANLLPPEEENVPVTSVQSVMGMLTNLPCNITPAVPGDRVNLVLWYKDGFGKPLYSFDLRGDLTDPDGKIWAGDRNSPDKPFRAQLHTRSAPTAVLSLLGVTEEDEGTYRCRVDFQRSPTRYWKVNLAVIVPPKSSRILDEKGDEVHGVIGPFNEMSTLILTCDVQEGKPSPRVTWWRNGDLIDDEFQEIAPGKSRNTMKMEALRREDFGAEFTCIGNNNNDTQPITNTVTLSMNLRPLETHLDWSSERSLSAGREYQIHCHTFGAQPQATMSWWLDANVRLKTAEKEVSAGGNKTTSVLTFTPSMSDHGRMLSCRSENPFLSNSVKADSIELKVQYPPSVKLHLGSNLNANDIIEGTDVYFECNVTAHPEASKVIWKHEGEILSPDSRRKIIMNEHSLVIQKVTRDSAGKYTCLAINDEGTGQSNTVMLDVKYSPVCQKQQDRSYGVGRNEQVKVKCRVDGNPPPSKFFWQFNSTSEILDLRSEAYTMDGSLSEAWYTPKDELDYGTLLCWARNSIGRQQRPCLFYVIPAGKPDPVEKCLVSNKTFVSFHVMCTRGYDGGLDQSFVLEVFPKSSYVLSPVKRLENHHFPQFTVTGLTPDTHYTLQVYAKNAKGASERTTLKAFTTKDAEKIIDQPEATKRNPPKTNSNLTMLIAGVLSILLLLTIILGFTLRSRCVADSRTPPGSAKRTNANNRFQRDEGRGHALLVTRSVDNHTFTEMGKGPDLIPHPSDHLLHHEVVTPPTEFHGSSSHPSQHPSQSSHPRRRSACLDDVSTFAPVRPNGGGPGKRFTTLPRNFHGGYSTVHQQSFRPVVHFQDTVTVSNGQPRPEITYAELTLPRTSVPQSSFHHPTSTVYATIDHREATPPVPPQFADPPAKEKQVSFLTKTSPGSEDDSVVNLTRF